MKLTQKDKEFLDRLRQLIDENGLSIELKEEDGLKRFVLRRNYGSYIEQSFGMTRQGVRWRFQRLFNQIYVEAYETILWVESAFGTELRSMAIAIARQRAELRRKALEERGLCVADQQTNT